MDTCAICGKVKELTDLCCTSKRLLDYDDSELPPKSESKRTVRFRKCLNCPNEDRRYLAQDLPREEPPRKAPSTNRSLSVRILEVIPRTFRALVRHMVAAMLTRAKKGQTYPNRPKRQRSARGKENSPPTRDAATSPLSPMSEGLRTPLSLRDPPIMGQPTKTF